jgi:pimeloyl-ACP methyl ester carboxylesterase
MFTLPIKSSEQAISISSSFPDLFSNIEIYWEEPQFARWLQKLASLARVIAFDKRGTGLSDRLEILPTMEERMDDARAVMDAAGSERAAIFGLPEAGSLATLFAAHYPERCRALVLWGALAKFSSWFPTSERLAKLLRLQAIATAGFYSRQPTVLQGAMSALGQK